VVGSEHRMALAPSVLTSVLAVSALLFFAAAPFPLIWRPWLSADYAAKALVEDDGKGLVFWIPAAARRWGHKTYGPLFGYTNAFENLDRHPLLFTLIDILSEDRSPDIVDVSAKLRASHNPKAQLLGCYGLERQPPGSTDSASCRERYHSALSGTPDLDHQMLIVTALRILQKSGMAGYEDEIQRLAADRKAPRWVRVEACRAAMVVPEREALAVQLKDLEPDLFKECRDES